MTDMTDPKLLQRDTLPRSESGAGQAEDPDPVLAARRLVVSRVFAIRWGRELRRDVGAFDRSLP